MPISSDNQYAHTNCFSHSSKAATYNDTHSPLVQAILAAIDTNATWIGIPSTGKVLDFACGTGLVSYAISRTNPSLVFRGIDISDQMIVKYKERFQEIGDVDADAVEVDLMDSSSFRPGSPIEGPNWLDFDMAAVANSLHHIEKTEIAVARLVERLKVGGVLCVIDWVDDGKDGLGHHHHHLGHGHKEKPRGQSEDEESLLKKHGVAHRHGFTQEGITKIMQDAGLENVGFREIDGPPLKFGEFERRVFVARGTKAKLTKLGFSKATPWTLMH